MIYLKKKFIIFFVWYWRGHMPQVADPWYKVRLITKTLWFFLSVSTIAPRYGQLKFIKKNIIFVSRYFKKISSQRYYVRAVF